MTRPPLPRSTPPAPRRRRAFEGDRIATRFQYESHDVDGRWWRSYGIELWEFDDEGYTRRREASVNDLRIDAAERRIHGPRPEAQRGGPAQPLC